MELVAAFNYDEAKLRETSPFIRTQQFLRQVVGWRTLAILEGDPGVGKTWGALSFARKHGIPFITVVERVLLEKAPSRFFKTIVREITHTEQASLWDALTALYHWAKSQDSTAAIFLDEAQWLTGKALDCFRRLHDATGITIVFIGHAGELSKLFARYPQAADRVGARFIVPPLSFDDLKKLHGNDFTDETLLEIFNVTRGNFRRLTRLMTYIIAAKGNLRQLTPADIRAISRRIAIE